MNLDDRSGLRNNTSLTALNTVRYSSRVCRCNKMSLILKHVDDVHVLFIIKTIVAGIVKGVALLFVLHNKTMFKHWYGTQ